MCARDGRGAMQICLSEKGALAKKRWGNTALARAQSLPVKYSVVKMILVTSLEFPWLMLIDERYCLIAGLLIQVSRFRM